MLSLVTIECDNIEERQHTALHGSIDAAFSTLRALLELIRGFSSFVL